jgi:predicted nuclease of restriction endonuclease-like (RecB) superfamily
VPTLVAASARSVEAPPSLVRAPAGYAVWLTELKSRIADARRRAVVAVNSELVRLYWGLGRDILQKQARLGWGAKVIDKLAHDLRVAFPEMRGFSRANLMYMRAFAEAWPDEAIVQQLVGQLSWGANLVLLARTKGEAERRYYAQKAVTYGWSRNLLLHHIESRDYERRGRATTNFGSRLSETHAALAVEALKDPYRFDFLGVGDEAHERDVENALVAHISRFLLELGAGFAFVGRQVHLEVGGEDFYIDLLFYHLRLRCYVVVELKAGEFRPEHAGKLNFYLSAVDSQVRGELDNPTIGLLLCKTKNRIIAEYALRDASKPMGVAEYQLVHALPAQLETSLPSIEQLEQELEDPAGHHHEASDGACTPQSSARTASAETRRRRR